MTDQSRSLLIVKKRRLNHAETEAEEPQTGQMKIIDLKDECLLGIFQHLNLIDLNNIVKASNRLKVGACMAFARNYAEETYTVATKALVATHAADGYKLPIFLMRFGCEVTKLIVVYQLDHHSENEYLDKAIIENCYGSLVDIEFRNFDGRAIFDTNGASKIAQKPFKKVNKVCFNRGVLAVAILLNFNQWFPNVQHLELKNVRFEKIERYCDRHFPKTRYIEQNHPNVRHLGIMNNESSGRGDEISAAMGDMLTNANVMNFIDLNPQLMSLTLMHDTNVVQSAAIDKNIKINGELLAHINEKLPHLESLHLVYSSVPAMSMNAPKAKLCFKELKSFTIEAHGTDVPKYLSAVSTVQLDHLTLDGMIFQRAEEDLAALFLCHQNVNKITIRGNLKNLEFEKIIHALTKLPNLREIVLVDGTQNESLLRMQEILTAPNQLRKQRIVSFLRDSMQQNHLIPLLAKAVHLECLCVEKWHNFRTSVKAVYVATFEMVLQEKDIRAAKWKLAMDDINNGYIRAVYTK